MAFPRLSASMLLASLILLLYWTTSSARSHDPPSPVVSPSYRVKREMASGTTDQVGKSLAVANNILTVVKEVIEKIDTKKLSAVVKCYAKIAGCVPVVGSLIAAFVDMVLIFIPQEDKVLNKVQKGFAEVNRKLDSISIQISNLATDVEWFNYASVYSQDELRILNSWKKFNELLHNSQLVQNEEDKLRLAEIFVNYYENTVTEASVANLYHYLTVKDTSLSGNLNELLRKKFKCDVQEIGKYNIYFSRLLWQGMVLNQFYWKLIGLDSSGIEAKHTQMFKNVYEAQISALKYCLTNHMEYVKEDVKEISKGLSADNKQAIADEVKKALDKKYNWYNWVVLVYNTDKHTSHELYNMTKIPVGTITVSVDYTQKAEEISKEQVKNNLDKCYKRRYDTRLRGGMLIKEDSTLCNDIATDILQCSHDVGGGPLREFVKVMHVSYSNDWVQVPEALWTNYCMVNGYRYHLFIYYSRNMSACHQNTCQNGKCKPLWDSNEYLCECPPSYHGDRCEKKIENKNVPAIDKGLTVPDITTINTKLKLMADKLEKILDYMRPAH
ncbi:SE-cephalotoxin-like [Sander lucioperca]|uniref:SE-cephalotoxin-like n=1 Tax=Sander lucioperca TaxID=283035 RepID=UPI001653C90D|nr:SE-cephalotoxin-like [Sander lucioperca]